ncbi:helix-turn-helix domain-containing protein [Acidicapsa acidisoli]|uniref:helix-turn-helix domain-containing protein n=1 Tax=Acidicapsa acidisoli TaxID=1615681 RepID=UPI0021DFCF24|nr:helix-turn-helix transcriptional regulator [Acidicapsa acidisoli]
MTNHPNRGRIQHWPQYLQGFRARFGLSQRQLAELLPSTVRDIEEIEQGIYAPRPYLKRALGDLAAELNKPPFPDSQ